MTVVRKSPAQFETPHHRKRNVVYYAGRTSDTLPVRRPRFLDVGGSGIDQPPSSLELNPKTKRRRTISTSGRGVTALEQNQRRGREDCAIFLKIFESSSSKLVPLIAFIPKRKQPNRVQEDRAHG